MVLPSLFVGIDREGDEADAPGTPQRPEGSSSSVLTANSAAAADSGDSVSPGEGRGNGEDNTPAAAAAMLVRNVRDEYTTSRKFKFVLYVGVSPVEHADWRLWLFYLNSYSM